jgi:glutamyl-tRNA(Gln) amidotransferase subunit E
MFPLLCSREAVRQHSLIELSQQMHERGLEKEDFEHTYVDVTHIFSLKNGNKAFAAIFPKMKGLFGLEVQPNKDFGEEIFEKSMLITGIPREDQFHSDEFQPNAVRKRSIHPYKLPIDEKKYGQIGSILNLGSKDAFILVAGPERRAMHAMKKIVERVKQALDGVPQETRRLLPNGNSEFLRVIHGKERIYPDTDTPPIVIPKDLANETKKTVYKRPWEIAEDLNSRFRFNQHQVDLLIRDEKTEKFYNYTEKLSLSGQLAYRILIELQRQKRREGKYLTSKATDTLAEALSRKLILPEQIDKVANILAENPSLTTKKIVKALRFKSVTKSELNRLIQQQLNSQDVAKLRTDETYRKMMIPRLVGALLKKINYSVEGKTVAEKIQALIRNGRKKNDQTKQKSPKKRA